MSSQGGCCGGSRTSSEAVRREKANAQVGKDINKPEKTGSLPIDKGMPTPTRTEAPSPKERHGGCCG